MSQEKKKRSLCLVDLCKNEGIHLFPRVTPRALLVMSHAYSNKRLSVPSASVARWLAYSSAMDAAAACRHYGLTVEGAAVRFDKTHFKADAALNIPKPLDIKEKLILSLSDIFTYTTPK